MLTFGIHVSKTREFGSRKARKTILDAIREDVDLGINFVQIFTHGPRNMRKNNIDYAAVAKYCGENNIGIVVHASYLTPSVWTKFDQEHIRKHLQEQLSACISLGAIGLVLHLPDLPPDAIVTKLREFVHLGGKASKSRLILETEPRKGINNYCKAERLNELCEAVSRVIPNDRWGLCIDTAHMWSSDIDLSSAVSMKEWMKEFKYSENIVLVHLNGGSHSRGCLKDVHEVVWSASDKIFGYNDSGFVEDTGAYFLIEWCRVHHIPVIMEINRGTDVAVDSAIEIMRDV
jgi:endonuclease IV